MTRSLSVLRVVPALLCAVILNGCHSQAGVAEPPRVARVAQVEAADANAIAVYPGEVHARFESTLGFRVAGKIRARHVDAGTHVSRDQVIAELDPGDLELARSSALASLASASAAFKLAESEYERYRTLFERRFVSQFEFDAKTHARDAARAQVRQAEAALETARNQTAYTALRADADGVIMALSAEVGQVVAAGQPVVTLARDGASEVEIDVPELAIAQIRLGAPARVELWTESGELHAGEVREIAPAADATTRTYRVRVSLTDATAAPRLGQTARVYFSSEDARAQFLVPLSALYEKDGKPAIWQVDAKSATVHLTPVEVAQYAESGALIGEGLGARQWIVTAGVHRLREGEVIRPIDAQNRRVVF
jgi:multidrug efflux system membrane fusion protein